MSSCVPLSLRHLPRKLAEGPGYVRVGRHLHDGHAHPLRLHENVGAGEAGDDGYAHRLREALHAVDLPFVAPAVEYDPPDAAGVVVRRPAEDVVRGVDRHELAGGDDVHCVGIAVPHRHGEPAAHDVAEDVVQGDVRGYGVRTQVLEEAEGGDYPPPGAANAGLWSARLHTEAAAVALGDDVAQSPVLRPGGAQVVENGALHVAPEQRAGGVVLRVAADLQHPHAHLPKGRGEVR